jgi:hypothetical protein
MPGLKSAKEHGRQMFRLVAESTPEALGKLADKIAAKHPHRRLSEITVNHVTEFERAAILEAMAEEAVLKRMYMVEVGRVMEAVTKLIAQTRLICR